MRAEGILRIFPKPDLDVLGARLREKAQEVDVTLPADVARYIAHNFRSNARASDRALMRVMAHSAVTGTEITLAFTQMVLLGCIEKERRKVAIDSLPELTPPPVGTKVAKVSSPIPMAADSFGGRLLPGGNASKKSQPGSTGIGSQFA